MITTKNLGIWMDHSVAHLMEHTSTPIDTKVIETIFQNKDHHSSNSENMMHNKEQQHQTEFYKKISAYIKEYDKVILFGPTDAKVELLNILTEDHALANIAIEVKQAVKMTDNQQLAFVKEHFS